MIDTTISGLAYVEHLSYIGFFLAVAFSGYVIPVPEEIILVLAGYLAAEGIISLPVVITVSVLGAVCGDTLIFYLSGHGSRFTKKYHRRVEKTHLGWYLRHMKNSPQTTIFLSRFLVGMRFFNPLVSGLMHIKTRIFVTSTIASAAIYVPIIIGCGYFFSTKIHTLVRVAESVRHGIIFMLVIGSVLLILLFFKSLWENAGNS